MAKPKSFDAELKNILGLKASEKDKEQLKALGIELKNPTKMTLLAAALYEKAMKGDLSSMREIFSRLEGVASGDGRVVLIDDIRNTDK